jgi:hypothetical protein
MKGTMPGQDIDIQSTIFPISEKSLPKNRVNQRPLCYVFVIDYKLVRNRFKTDWQLIPADRQVI